MKKNKKEKSFPPALFLLLFFIFPGCIRFAGKAGYVYQGPRDEAPKSRQIEFDTRKIISGSNTDPPKVEITPSQPGRAKTLPAGRAGKQARPS